jgi:hypothetical protein
MNSFENIFVLFHCTTVSTISNGLETVIEVDEVMIRLRKFVLILKRDLFYPLFADCGCMFAGSEHVGNIPKLLTRQMDHGDSRSGTDY